MRQTQLTAPKKIESFEIARPKVEPGWVLAKTLRTGICGTDVHSYFGETIFGKVFPFHIGHEICAVVEEVSPENRNLKPGDTIVVNPFFTCGACSACYAGMENNCAHKTTIGLKGFGGFSEYIYLPAASAYRVESEDYTAMSLAEPLATVIYAYDKLRVEPNQRVLIQGVGPIGLMFLQLFAAAKVRELAASDFNREKLAIAEKLGATAVYCPLDSSAAQLAAHSAEGFDIVVDCTGSIRSMQEAPGRIAFGGQIMLFGLCAADKTMEIQPFALYQKDASILTSFALNKRSFRKAIALLESGSFQTELLIDSVQPHAELERSILRLAEGKANGKIVINTASM